MFTTVRSIREFELLRGIDITTGEVTWWHLRSPGEATNVNASVNAIGLIDYHGAYDGVLDPTGGIRPAMWISTAEVEAPAEETYTVAAGDCLWNLAVKFYGNGAAYTKIVEANGIKDANLIYVGQKLVIPAK